MASNFLPFTLPPGVSYQSSNALSTGRWNNANLVRWTGSRITPVAGWEKYGLTGAAIVGTIRGLHTWSDNNGIVRTAVITETNAYVLEDSTVFDISPASAMTGPDADITAGGYGDDVYSGGTYGTPRPTRTTTRSIGYAVTVDNWGEDLVFMTSWDGRLLRWKVSLGTGTPSVVVPNAPTSNRSFVVTPERYIIVFGAAGLRNRFQWCDQEDIETWTVGTTTTAGFYDIEPLSPIVAAKIIKNGSLMFTATDAYLVRYIGVPFIYDYELVSGTSAPITADALSEFGGKGYWWADDGFWSSDGISIEAVPCDVWSLLKETLDPAYSRYRISSTPIGSQTEIWWMYPNGDTHENTRIVIYDPVQKWWSLGKLTRTCGYKAAFNTYPIMTDGTNLYKHESGLFYADFTELPWAETGAFNMKGGAVMTYTDAMIVDHGAPVAAVLYTIKGYITRQSQQTGPEITVGPKHCRSDGYLEARLTARDIVLRIESAANGVPLWSLGAPLVNGVARGSR